MSCSKRSVAGRLRRIEVTTVIRPTGFTWVDAGHPNKLYEGLVFVGSKSKGFAIDEQSLVTLVEVMLLGARHDSTSSFQDNEEQLAMVVLKEVGGMLLCDGGDVHTHMGL